MVTTRDALSDAINATGNSTGLVAAQVGKSGGSYQANIQAGKQIIEASKIAKEHIADDGPSANASGGSSFLLNASAGAAAVAIVSAAAPAIAGIAATVGIAHTAVSLASNLASNNKSETSFLNDADEDIEVTNVSSAPSRNIELQETVNAPAMAANDEEFYASFAESLDESIAEKGQDQVLKEVTEGPTLKAAEGQIKFSQEQLAELDREAPRPYVAAPAPMMMG